MTKIAYFECPTGIAGDMCLGALVHAGVPLAYLTEQLTRLGVGEEFRLWSETVSRNGQAATKVHVDLVKGDGTEYATFAASDPRTALPETSHAEEGGDRHHNRCLPDIEAMIRQAGLPPRAEAWSLMVFRQLAEAEGAVHGLAADQIHFHEVGATDAIVDIVGTCLGLDWLKVEAIYCSALPMGGGTIRAAHGRLPVPAPAVLKLWELRQVPIYSNGIAREMVTPTGAALVTTLATDFGAPPPLRLQQVGLGAGSRDFSLPNILRLWLGETTEEGITSGAIAHPQAQAHPHPHPHPPEHNHILHHSHDPNHPADHAHPHATVASPSPRPSQGGNQDRVMVLETQVDDLSPQAIAFTQEQLLKAGAVDAFTQAVTMKKSRLGSLITVICPPERVLDCEAVLFRETTTLGIRRSPQQRTLLQRHIETVETPYGSVRIKVARPDPEHPITHAHPEYEDCAQLARHHAVPWREIHRVALQTWHQQEPNWYLSQ